jgi:hypothetical protein
MAINRTLAERLAAFEAEHEWLRQITLPEEDRSMFTSAPSSGYRWFRAPNIICLETVRRLRRRA